METSRGTISLTGGEVMGAQVSMLVLALRTCFKQRELACLIRETSLTQRGQKGTQRGREEVAEMGATIEGTMVNIKPPIKPL